MRFNTATMMAITAGVLLSACGAQVTDSIQPLPDSTRTPAVTISPPSVQMAPSSSLSFSATVSGLASQSFVWSIKEGSAGGSVASNGHYTAPPAVGTFHIVATDASNGASSEATVVVSANPITVAVNPAATTLAPGGVQQFTATVAGASAPALTWTVREGSPGGAVTSAGAYSAPTSAGTYHVVVALAGDSSVSAVAAVTVAATTPVPPVVPPVPPAGLVFPPDVPLVAHAMPALSRPGYLSLTTDPTFGTTIQRIGTEGTGASSMRHHYAKDQPWNADGSLVKLNAGATIPILDGNTYAFIKNVSAPGNDNVWSNVDPNKIYGGHGNTLVSINVASGSRTTMRTFSNYSSIYIGDSEGNFSDDDHYACLVGVRGGTSWVISYDNFADAILAEMDTGGIIDNCTVSHSGAFMVVNGVSGAGTRSYRTSNLSFVAQVSSNRNHFDVCYASPGGEEVVVKEDNGFPVISISTGALLRQALPGVASPQSHVSCRNIQRPGWAYVSPEGASGDAGKVPWQRIMAVSLDGSSLVENFAHGHGESGASPYDGAPMAVPNRTGDRVMWKVAWDGSGSVYSYVAHQ